jgi:YqaJ-like viral recombinase domain
VRVFELAVVVEPPCLVHDQLEWMRASLDGLSFDGPTVLEIKCPMNVRDQASAKRGSVPPQYYAQLQHQVEVSRAAELHYWTFDGSAESLIRVGPDPEYLKRLLDAEAAFWQLVRDNVWPEAAGGELDLSADPKWRHVALRYREAKVRLEPAAAEEHKLRAILESLATARRTFGCGVGLLRSLPKGSGRLRRDSGAAWRQSGNLPQDAGSGRQDQFSRARWSSIRRRWKSFSAFVIFVSSSAGPSIEPTRY